MHEISLITHQLLPRVHVVLPVHLPPSRPHGYRESLRLARRRRRLVVVIHLSMLLLYRNVDRENSLKQVVQMKMT